MACKCSPPGSCSVNPLWRLPASPYIELSFLLGVVLDKPAKDLLPCGWPCPGSRRARLCPHRGDGAGAERGRAALTFANPPGSAERFIINKLINFKSPVLHSNFQKVLRNTQGGRRASSSPRQPPFKLAALFRTGGKHAASHSRGLVWFCRLVCCFVGVFFPSHGMIQLCRLGLFSFFHKESKSERNDAKYRGTL